jgi:hypothetical protein
VSTEDRQEDEGGGRGGRAPAAGHHRSEALATAVTMAAWGGLLLLLYVILISSVTGLEVAVGAGFALLGAVAAEALRRAEHPRAHGSRRLAAATAAFPLTLLAETGQLAVAVAQAIRGRATPGRRLVVRLEPQVDTALASALLSASPGACVLDVAGVPRLGGFADDPPERDPGSTPEGGRGGDLVVHVLAGPPSRVERALGARRPA